MAPSDATEFRPLVVGLTGGIASGKTAAADRFASLGVPIVDTDVIARDVVAPGSAGLARVIETFGPELLGSDGQLDRRQMRQRVFENPGQRKQLEAILHPLIRDSLWAQVRASTADYVIVVVPLLIEGGLYREVDRVLVVDVTEEIQRQRLRERDGSDDAEVEAILAAQCARERRLEHADDIIDNNGTIDQLVDQVEALHPRYRDLALSR